MIRLEKYIIRLILGPKGLIINPFYYILKIMDNLIFGRKINVFFGKIFNKLYNRMVVCYNIVI